MTSLAPFLPSPYEVVKGMLEMANVGCEDTVFDLGSGDGRILIVAVKDFGAKKAVGFEMRADLCEQALQEVKKNGLEDRISIVNGDFFSSNFSEATVITLSLTPSGTNKLRSKLAEETTQRTRIVSHDFEILLWHYTRKARSFGGHSIYLYVIPEALTLTFHEKIALPFKRSFYFLNAILWSLFLKQVWFWLIRGEVKLGERILRTQKDKLTEGQIKYLEDVIRQGEEAEKEIREYDEQKRAERMVRRQGNS